MITLIDFAIRAEYARVKALGDDLCEIGSQIDWERFRFLEPSMYKNKTSRGGRPNIDIVIMVKLLVFQHWYSYQILNWNGRMLIESHFVFSLTLQKWFPITVPFGYLGASDQERQNQ